MWRSFEVVDIAVSDIQENFKSKADGDLLALASNASEMTPESRIVLLEELQRRFDAIKDRPTTIQLIHGWYTVFVQRSKISFPDKCPNCLRQGADTSITVTSQTHTRHRVVYVKHQNLTLRFPFCRECAKKLTRRGKMISWPSYCAVIAWLAACWKFDLGRLAAVSGILLLSLPMALLSRQGAAVTLGDFGEDWLECRFRSSEYAEAFASVNHVVAQNTETVWEEFEVAINSVQGLPSGVSMPTTRNADYVYMVRPKKD
jgi:hypothetical protein